MPVKSLRPAAGDAAKRGAEDARLASERLQHSPFPDKHEAARDAVARGFRVFPLRPGTKAPAIKEWQIKATSDLAIVRRVWGSGEYNIGILCEGMIVLDVDVKDGRQGLLSLEALGIDLDTYTVETPSGGRHLYFAGPDVRNSVGALGPGLDVRSHGGFVVAPGSCIGGRYYRGNDQPIRPAPRSLVERCGLSRDVSDRPNVAAESDTDAAIALAQDYLEKRAPLAVEGRGGDHTTTFTVAAFLKDFGVSEDKAIELIALHWNDRCSPPWEDNDLAVKVTNAYRYGENTPGSKSPAHWFEGIDLDLGPGPSAAIDLIHAGKWAQPFQWQDPASIPRREWLYRPHFIRGYVTVTFAAGGAGKTTVLTAEALSVTSGKPLLGVSPAAPTKVWIWNGEDPADEMRRRIQAAMLQHELTPLDVEGRLFTGSGRDADLIIANQTREGAVVAKPVVEALITFILENNIGAVIVDPFVSCHRVTENDNGAIDRVAKAWGQVADAARCAVHLVHHTRKTNGQEASVEDGRGASALLSAARYARVLNTMSKEEARRLGVEERHRRAYVRIDEGKQNLTPPAASAGWIRLTGVELGNGDNVQAAVFWTPPDHAGAITPAETQGVLDAVRAGRSDGRGWRNSIQSPDWVGHAVAQALGLDLDQPADQARTKALIKGWMNSGQLVKVDRAFGAKGKSAPFVEVGTFPHLAMVGGEVGED